jgi:hypothetical protein
MPLLEWTVFIATIVLVLLMMIFSFLILKKNIFQGSYSYRKAILSYFLITMPSPAVVYLIVFFTANFVNNRPHRFELNPIGSIWNGDAALGLLLIIVGLFVCVSVANVLFITNVLTWRAKAGKKLA